MNAGKKNDALLFLAKPLVIILFLLVIFILISSNIRMGEDEGMWNYIGRIWVNNGIPPYKGAIENKTPGIFYLHAISNSLFGINNFFVRSIGILFVLLSSFILYLIAKELHSFLAGIFSMYVFGLTMTWSLVDGPYAQTETFMLLFSVLSFYCMVRGRNDKRWKYWVFGAGICIGLAIMFKQVAVTTFAALICFLLVCTVNKLTRLNKVGGIILLTAGMGLTTALLLLPIFLSNVSLKEYIDGAWIILLNNGSRSILLERVYYFFKTWQDSRIVIFYPFLLLLFIQGDLVKSRYFIALLLWFCFDLVGVNLSGHYYGHQIKQILAPLSLIIGISLSNFIVKWNDKAEHGRIKDGVIIVFLIFLLFPYKEIALNMGMFIKRDTEYPDKELALWLKKNTAVNDHIYILGPVNGPLLYYSERVSSSRYFNATFLTTIVDNQKMIADVKTNLPELILKPQHLPTNTARQTLAAFLPSSDSSEGLTIQPELDKFIRDNYCFLLSKYNYDILKHKN